MEENRPKQKNNRAKLAVIIGIIVILAVGLSWGLFLLYNMQKFPDTPSSVSKRNRELIGQAVNSKSISMCNRIKGGITAADLRASTTLAIMENTSATRSASTPDKTQSEAQAYCRILVDISKSE